MTRTENNVEAWYRDRTGLEPVATAYIVVMTTAGGRYRRRSYLTLPAAVAAADRARDRGESVSLELFALVPAGGTR